MGSYSQAVDEINDTGKKQAKNSCYTKSQCQAHGCPLGVLSQTGSGLCGYHNDRNLFHSGVEIQTVTRNINENIRWVRGYRRMTKWGMGDWDKYSDTLKHQEFCPMNEGELPTVYMNRFYQTLNQTILSAT